VKTGLKKALPVWALETHEARVARAAMRRGGATASQARLRLPRRSLHDAFPEARGALVHFDADTLWRGRDMALPLAETLALGAICRAVGPRRALEIGTFTGATTLAIARNAPGCRVWTLDLPKDELQKLGFDFPVGEQWKAAAQRDEELASRIVEVRQHSRRVDAREWEGTMDFVFVDADHSYAAVRHDTQLALQVLAPGGVIVWDDYDWTGHPDCVGVARALQELPRSQNVFHIEGTRLAAFRDPRPRDSSPRSANEREE
jgi:predicted O-methyltransferase YrrM